MHIYTMNHSHRQQLRTWAHTHRRPGGRRHGPSTGEQEEKNPEEADYLLLPCHESKEQVRVRPCSEREDKGDGWFDAAPLYSSTVEKKRQPYANAFSACLTSWDEASRGRSDETAGVLQSRSYSRVSGMGNLMMCWRWRRTVRACGFRAEAS